MPVCSTTKPSRAVSEIARWFALPRAPTAQNEITLLEKVKGGWGVCVHEVIMLPEYYTRKGGKSVVEHLYSWSRPQRIVAFCYDARLGDCDSRVVYREP
ncbi:hypothetical protein CDAR_251591 [Caerostris darwini]|uniref:Uncharacterized protein n=1 Tax=Caerostris darwini TaxID=1538125 RepID=A0AAV4RF86_9ARAC|nr:hypothetical protein CDAR_251591 [Caerostris darwini]